MSHRISVFVFVIMLLCKCHDHCSSLIQLSPPLNRRHIVSIDLTKCESSRCLTMGSSDPLRSYPSMSSCTYQEFKSDTKTVLTETRTFKDLASIQQTTDYNTQSKISSNMSVAPLISKKSKSKSKKTLFNVGQCKQYNISSHLKWVLVADKSMHIIIYNKIRINNSIRDNIHKAQ